MPRSKPRTAPPAKLDLSPSSVTLRAQDHEPKRVTVRAQDSEPNACVISLMMKIALTFYPIFIISFSRHCRKKKKDLWCLGMWCTVCAPESDGALWRVARGKDSPL
jgi:hypothetical protein